MATFLVLWGMVYILLDGSVTDECMPPPPLSGTLVLPKDDNGLFQYRALAVSSVRDREISSYVWVNRCYSPT